MARLAADVSVAGVATANERWFAPDWTMLPLAARQCRVRNPLTGAVAELSADQYAVLRACEGCRTLTDHTNIVRQKLNVRPEDVATITQWLHQFAASGLLTPVSDLVARLEGASSVAPAPFAGVVIRTCDRPPLLERALDSATSLAHRHGHRYRYLVLDDSRHAPHRAANRAIVAANRELDCAYVDLAMPTAIEQELRRQYPDAQSIIDWLIGPAESDEATYGRPVNCALLLTAGARVLMQDDDAVLEARSPPIAEPGFSVSAHADQLFCYSDAEALYADCPPLDIDPVAAHVDVLGRGVYSLWKRFSEHDAKPPAISLDAEDAARFSAGARVLFTQNHALGDPGSSLFPYHLLSLPDASKARLFRDPDWPRYVFARRINWRGQPQRRLATRRPFTLTTLAGIDNSVLMPPTARAQRNEDLLLGEIAQLIHPNGWFVDLPFGLPHWRDPAKAWLDPSSAFAQEPIHFLMDYVGQRAQTIVSAQPDDRLRTIGAWLRDLANAGERRLTDLLAEQVADTATRTLFSIAAQLDNPALPAAWKDLLLAWLASPALSTQPAKLRMRIAPATTVRALAFNYANALEIWPALWNTAREMSCSNGSFA